MKEPQRRSELVGEGARRLVADLRILREGPFDDADEGVGQIRTQVPQPPALVFLVRFENLVFRASLDGIGTRHEVENQDAKAVDVRHHRRGSAAEELRGQIEGRSGDLVLRRDPPRQLGAGAEVHEDDASAFLAHDVLALHVAVQEPRTVDRRQGLTEIDADRRRLARAVRPVGLQHILERAAADELHPQAHPTVYRLRAVDRHDVRMAHAREQPGLVEHRVRIEEASGSFRPEQLERDLAIESVVSGAIDDSEGAFADALENGEMPPALDLHRDLFRFRGRRQGSRGTRLVHARDSVERAQRAHHVVVLPVGCLVLGLIPVDRLAAGNGLGERQPPVFAMFGFHSPSPSRASPARG